MQPKRRQSQVHQSDRFAPTLPIDPIVSAFANLFSRTRSFSRFLSLDSRAGNAGGTGERGGV
jgi:hypothetical protein